MPTEIWSSRLRAECEGGGGRGDGRHTALIKSRGFHLAGGEQMFQYVFGRERGGSFQDFPRKVAKVYFRHMDAAKEKPQIAKGSRKRWRKGRQNRTQIIGVSATAHLVLGTGRAVYVYIDICFDFLKTDGMIRGQFGAQVDLIFSALFVIDIACRFFIEGRRFFFGPGARWILFLRLE